MHQTYLKDGHTLNTLHYHDDLIVRVVDIIYVHHRVNGRVPSYTVPL